MCRPAQSVKRSGGCRASARWARSPRIPGRAGSGSAESGDRSWSARRAGRSSRGRTGSHGNADTRRTGQAADQSQVPQALAERVGFEPTKSFDSALFKSAAINRSATSPSQRIPGDWNRAPRGSPDRLCLVQPTRHWRRPLWRTLFAGGFGHEAVGHRRVRRRSLVRLFVVRHRIGWAGRQTSTRLNDDFRGALRGG